MLMMVNLVCYYNVGTLILQTAFIPDVVHTEDECNVLIPCLLIQLGGMLALALLCIGSAYFCLSVQCHYLVHFCWMRS